MPTITTCPSCNGPLRIPDELVGRRVRCPSCQTIFDAAAAPAPPPAPAPQQPAWKNLQLELDRGDPEPPPDNGPPSRRPAPPPRLKGAVEVESSGDPAPPPPRREPPPPRPQPRRYPADDEDDDYRGRRPYDRGPPRRDAEPHRGALVLVLGIVSLSFVLLSMCYGLGTLVGLPLGIAAWVLGTIDLRKIKNQEMDQEGLGTTQAGWICGIIGTILHSLVLLTCGAFIAFLIVTASNAPSRPMAPKPGFGAPPVVRP